MNRNERRSIRHGGLKLRTQRRERSARMGVYVALRALAAAGFWDNRPGFRP